LSCFFIEKKSRKLSKFLPIMPAGAAQNPISRTIVRQFFRLFPIFISPEKRKFDKSAKLRQSPLPSLEQ
jgi:hypothetical protein